MNRKLPPSPPHDIGGVDTGRTLNVCPSLTSLPGRFSVVVPVFNSRRHLKACLDSVMSAIDNYGQAELIVIDNGSTDGSYELIRETYQRAILCRVSGVNIADLRNRGAQIATGEYLTFIDSDCVIGDTYFYDAVNALATVDADAVGSMYALPPTATWIERNWHGLHRRNHDGYVNYLNSCNLVVKKSAFVHIGGFDARLVTGEDVDLAHRLREAGFKIYECHAVRAIHLGIPLSVRQFIRRQAWYARGMTGDLHSWKPLAALLLHCILILFGFVGLFVAWSSEAVRAATFLLLINIVPAVCVWYRLHAGGQPKCAVFGFFLYHCFCLGRVYGFATWLVTGKTARTYHKEPEDPRLKHGSSCSIIS